MLNPLRSLNNVTYQNVKQAPANPKLEQGRDGRV